MELLNLDDFRHNYVNMTGFRILKRDQLAFKEIAQTVPSFLNASFGIGAALAPSGNFVLTVSKYNGFGNRGGTSMTDNWHRYVAL